MKVAGINQLAPARFTQPLPKALLADGWRSVRGKLRAPLFYGVTTALCALAVLLLSVLLIGGLDRRGVAPQSSFLGLNLTLIACCLLMLFSPLRARIRHGRATQEAGAASAAVKRMGAEPVGKLLIIRRDKRMSKDFVDAR
jgi:hypothetical protein